MIEINLLPRGEAATPLRQRAAEFVGLPSAAAPKIEPWAIGLGASGLLVLLLAAWSWSSTSAAVARLESEVARELEDSTRHAATFERIAAARARQDTLQQKLDFIRTADADRYLWPRLLDEISAALPPSTWLTRLGSADGAEVDGPVVVIEGASASTQLLTSFMKHLEASPLLREVTLVTTEQPTGLQQVHSRFALEVRHEGTNRAPLARLGSNAPGR